MQRRNPGIKMGNIENAPGSKKFDANTLWVSMAQIQIS